MAKKVTGYIKLQIPAGKKQHQRHQLVLLWVSTVLISYSLQKNLMQELQTKAI